MCLRTGNRAETRMNAGFVSGLKIPRRKLRAGSIPAPGTSCNKGLT